MADEAMMLICRIDEFARAVHALAEEGSPTMVMCEHIMDYLIPALKAALEKEGGGR